MSALVSPLLNHLYQSGRIKNVFDAPGEFVKSVYLPFYTTGEVQQTYYFTPDSMIDGQNAIIKGIEIVDLVTAANSIFPTRDNPVQSVLAQGYLTLSDTKREQIAVIPLVSLMRRINNGRLYFTDIQDHVWQTCFVEFTTTTAVTSAVGLQFLIYYDKK